MAERLKCHFLYLVFVFLVPNLCESVVFSGKDVTPLAFGPSNQEIFPVAYGDFNSDKITDIFAVSRDRSSLHIYFGFEEAPFFRLQIQCLLLIDWESKSKDFVGKNAKVYIVGVTPADFTGDGILDVMVTFQRNVTESSVEVIIFRGNLTTLDCGGNVYKHQTIEMLQEPLLLDVNGDMIMDLFGERKPHHTAEMSETATLSQSDKHNNDTTPGSTAPNTTTRGTTTPSTTTRSTSTPAPVPHHAVTGFWIFPASISDPDDKSPVKTPPFYPFKPKELPKKDPDTKNYTMAYPHCNTFVDIDGDFIPELVVFEEAQVHVDETNTHKNTTQVFYRMNVYRVNLKGDDDFRPTFNLLHEPLEIDTVGQTNVIGQPLFIDMNQEGKLVQLLPFCTDKKCAKNSGSGIMLITNGTEKPVKLPIEFADSVGKHWNFLPPKSKTKNETNYVLDSNYTQTVILRAGDYNLDGYPDLIGILRSNLGHSAMSGLRAVIFENVPCVPNPPENLACENPRTFKINFDVLAQYENAVMASFFDIHEDGLVDVILVRRTNNVTTPWGDTYGVFAFQNSPDYDANFMKVMVLTGRDCPTCPLSKIPYGNVISGPVITYHTTNQAGNFQTSVAAQSYRSSHNALDMPYTIFGIGQSPNFIETLQIFVSSTVENRTSIWSQIIPNSQLIVIPVPLSNPNEWSAKLFLTPSRAVLNTFGVLVGFCGLIFLIVAGLQFKEQREDRKGRLQEAHRFHMM